MALYEKTTIMNTYWVSANTSLQGTAYRNGLMLDSDSYYWDKFYNPRYGGDETPIIDLDIHKFYNAPSTRPDTVSAAPIFWINKLMDNENSLYYPTLNRLDSLTSPYYDGRAKLDPAINITMSGLTLSGYYFLMELPIKNKPVGIITNAANGLILNGPTVANFQMSGQTRLRLDNLIFTLASNCYVGVYFNTFNSSTHRYNNTTFQTLVNGSSNSPVSDYIDFTRNSLISASSTYGTYVSNYVSYLKFEISGTSYGYYSFDSSSNTLTVSIPNGYTSDGVALVVIYRNNYRLIFRFSIAEFYNKDVEISTIAADQ